MWRCSGLLGVAICAGMLAGCVERRFVIETDQPGAAVFVNGESIGASPVDHHFIYYGKYDFTIVKDGYQTLQVHQDVPAPWYEWFLIDSIAENCIPWQIVDRRPFFYQLQPLPAINPNELLGKAQNLRNRGWTVVPPPDHPSAGTPPATLLPPAPGAPGTMPAVN